MSLETAGRAFIGLAFALLGGGVIVLHAALHRRWSPWPLLTFFFLYNSVFLRGFLNYLFGLGLALLICALWMVLRDRSAALLVPLFSVLAVVLFFAHLFAFGCFAMIVLSYEFGQWWRHRRDPVRLIDLPGWKAVPSILLPLILLIQSQTFRVSSDDYPLWLRGSPPPPAVTYIALNGETRSPERDHPNRAPTPGSLDGAHADRPDRNWVGSSSLLFLAVDVFSTRRHCAGRCGDAQYRRYHRDGRYSGADRFRSAYHGSLA